MYVCMYVCIYIHTYIYIYTHVICSRHHIFNAHHSPSRAQPLTSTSHSVTDAQRTTCRGPVHAALNRGFGQMENSKMNF